MSSPDWRPADYDDREKDEKFGDALADLAIDDAPEVDSLEGVRESREDV